jgi:hypothetical protein
LGRLKAGHFHVALLQNIPVMFQWLPPTRGESMQHGRNMVDNPIALRRRHRTFSDAQWRWLGPGWRTIINKFRQQAYLSPIPEPAADLGSPFTPPPAPRLFDHSNLPARALASDFGTPEERELLWQELLASTAAMLTAHDGDPRVLAQRLRQDAASPEELELAADLLGGKIGRPTRTLHREIGEHVAATLLRTWDRLPLDGPERRKPQRTVFRWIEDAFGISRRQAYRLLKAVREHEKRR